MRVDINDISKELEFQTSRSSGPGGQNVNKVNSRVTLRLDIKSSQVLNQKEKNLIFQKLKSKINKEGILIISEEGSRSQLKNKEEALRKLESHLRQTFARKKPRIKTKPSKAAKEKRLIQKKKLAEKKQFRRERF